MASIPPCSLPTTTRASQCRPSPTLSSVGSRRQQHHRTALGRRAPAQQHALVQPGRWQPWASVGPSPCASSKNQEAIQGYTPANYISYSEEPEHACRHMIGVNVRAPVSVCFDLWNDWARLVDFLDLISQIGLDPDEPDMGLFQCFYRWGRMPVMEIVFLARKSHAEADKLIQFETVWGLPAKGEVEFIEDGLNTTVLFRFEHQMPALLVDLKVEALHMETHLKKIFAENMEDFKQLAEMLAQDPANAPPRRTAEVRKPTSSSGAPQASQPQAGPRPWDLQQGEQAQVQASSSADTGSETGSVHPGRQASPHPAPSPQQPQASAHGEREGEQPRVRRGRPRSKKPSATPPPSGPDSTSPEQMQGRVSAAGGTSSREEGGEGGRGAGKGEAGQAGSGRRARRTPARSSSPSASLGQQGGPPPPGGHKRRRSRSAANSQ